MDNERLEPRLELLRKEYVLAQAWKKTASYIRSHNWYVDTLELDRTSINLPRFLGDLAERMQEPGSWQNDPIRLVPAPKAQDWAISKKRNAWTPKKTLVFSNIRPLAHVSLQEQVAATAVMLCLADRVETRQGDVRVIRGDGEDGLRNIETRKTAISYGNRLFCDSDSSGLCHRWGSAKLYRSFFQDYRSFISRPAHVADNYVVPPGYQVLIVNSDLSKFFDRVHPHLLDEKISTFVKPGDDSQFFDLVRRLFSWGWHSEDLATVTRYANECLDSDFSTVALPQGLVSAGFFANVVLTDLDHFLQNSIGEHIAPNLRLLDVCRYVDDLRFVIVTSDSTGLTEVQETVAAWLIKLLTEFAPGLKVSEQKTQATAPHGDKHPLLRHSRTMERIQGAVSGGFDVAGGQNIIDTLQGMVQRKKAEQNGNDDWALSPVPDVRDETMARFAGARFRKTFRSVRPMLEEDADFIEHEQAGEADDGLGLAVRYRTKGDLDVDAEAFALRLVGLWVRDPSNVRLLRIAIDMWPSHEVLSELFRLLRPHIRSSRTPRAKTLVASYCLSEILRAGATEAGYVDDDEALPAKLDLVKFRKVLLDEAIDLMTARSGALPWYLVQQACLVIATFTTSESIAAVPRRHEVDGQYGRLLRFLSGRHFNFTIADYATFAVLARRSFLTPIQSYALVSSSLTGARLNAICKRDPVFAYELIANKPEIATKLSSRHSIDLSVIDPVSSGADVTLAELVLKDRSWSTQLLRNEPAILLFASKLLGELSRLKVEVVTPLDVFVNVADYETGFADTDSVVIRPSKVKPDGSTYRPPTWCQSNDRWRFQLGYLIRFILMGCNDFVEGSRAVARSEGSNRYRACRSHWLKRCYGIYNGHSAFHDDWLPVSEWTEQLLFALLSWPGCRPSELANVVKSGRVKTRNCIGSRITNLRTTFKLGSQETLFLPLTTSRPDRISDDRPLRACIVQTVFPTDKTFSEHPDFTLSYADARRQHRNHLSTALAAVNSMLRLRETHHPRDKRLDLLVLPELSVHPSDVRTHLIPFARANKTIIVAGLTYEELFLGVPLVNSALWIIPTYSLKYGLQIVTRRQGKMHLAEPENAFNSNGAKIQSFRPCQWLVQYKWSNDKHAKLMWLSASVCYDATDLNLLACLRDLSDVFIITALNKDIKTFDNMASSLHYHMFQYVIVANNGMYGGSSAYVPFHGEFERQVFHLHGQPQASVAFLEIDNIGALLNRRRQQITQNGHSFKCPPAGVLRDRS